MHVLRLHLFDFFFFNDTATTEIYTLSLHDALPISWRPVTRNTAAASKGIRTAAIALIIKAQCGPGSLARSSRPTWRSEEHTSELQSQSNLVCRLLLEKKNKRHDKRTPSLIVRTIPP